MSSKKGNISVPLLFIVILLVAGAFVFLRSQPSSTPASNLPPVLRLPTPTPKTQEVDVHSGDGTMKLVMRTQKNPDGSTMYTFIASDIIGGNPKPILAQTVSPGGTMSIPLNTWSPDNKYIFVQKNEAGLLRVFVLKASGEPFANNEPYLDVGTLFTKNQTKYAMTTATGWASGTLLIITTASADPAVKTPNYWFEVPSRAFLQLAR